MQEVEPIDRYPVFDGECQPTHRNRVGDPRYPRRAIGIFSYTDTVLTPVDLNAPMYGFRRFEARRGDLVFQVAAVWTAKTDSPKAAFRQAHEGIDRHKAWILRCPTMIMGDFNANASFQGTHWKELMDRIESLGLVSAYHHFFNEAFGAETRPTYFHRSKQGAGSRDPQLDYCFVPSSWASHTDSVKVGAYQDWQGVSDHVPLIVDIALPV